METLTIKELAQRLQKTRSQIYWTPKQIGLTPTNAPQKRNKKYLLSDVQSLFNK
jgi:hypothetical protein